MEERVKAVMAAVFGIDAADIDESTSPEDLPKWDSQGHMSLVVALEQEFDVEFDDAQMLEMLSCELVVRIVREALGEH